MEKERNCRAKKGEGRKQLNLQQEIENKKKQTEENRNGEARRTPKRVIGRLRAPFDLPFFYYWGGLRCFVWLFVLGRLLVGDGRSQSHFYQQGHMFLWVLNIKSTWDLVLTVPFLMFYMILLKDTLF